METLKANELRIGNYIQWQDESKDIETVKGIYYDDEINEYFVKIDHHSEICLFEFEGVEITERWLKKFGFNSENWRYLQTHYFELIHTVEDDIKWYYPIYAEIGELSNEPEQRVSLNRIRCVHELQNLYFALTGKEL